jgi:ribokinase
MSEVGAMGHRIVILGVFVADTAYRASRQPKIGETVLGSGFSLGPGGKGSNQAVAAARAGGDVAFITRLGRDAFGEMAKATWAAAGVHAVVTEDAASYTGAAYIFLDEASGDNAIIVAPGAAANLTAADMEQNAALIGSARVFVTQLEQPLEAAVRALQLARAGGAITILNPAPAQPLDSSILALTDVLTPNESEAEILTGIPVNTPDDARKAADILLARGVGTVIVTLGGQGALYHTPAQSVLVPAFKAGAVIDTTGAGDAFTGGFAVALAEGRPPLDAMRFGAALAGISVTRRGTAPAMPSRAEIDALLAATET